MTLVKRSLVSTIIYTSLCIAVVNAQYGQQPLMSQQPQMNQQQYMGQPHAHPNQPAYGQVPQMGQANHPGQPQHHQQVPAQGQNILHDQGRIHDKEHLKEHLHGVLGEPDVSKMSEEELQFHYFKMHDNDNNNKLDGCELIKSLIHWHVEESKHLGANAPPHGTTKLFTDAELSQMIDPILDMDDRNRDGYIDYPEFVAAQKTRGF